MNISDLRSLEQRASSLETDRPWRIAEVHQRINASRRRRTAAAAAGLAVAVALGGAVISRSLFADRANAPAGPTSTIAGGWCTADPTVPELLRKRYVGLPPAGAMPSSSADAELVLSYFGGDQATGGHGKSNVWLFDDGRLITEREATTAVGANTTTTGYLERCLSPSGVAALSQLVLREGRRKKVEPPYPAWLNVRSGEWVIEFDALAFDEKKKLLEPEQWLPADAWVDIRFRAYVPTRYAVCYHGPAGYPDTLPALAKDLLGDRSREVPGPGSGMDGCVWATVGEARRVVEAVEQAWFSPGRIVPHVTLDVGLSRHPSTPTPTADRNGAYLGVEPILPNGQTTCNCG